MIYKYEYNKDDLNERQNIVNQNADKYLILEENITEGNFLTFSDVQPPQPEIQILIKEVDLKTLQDKNITLETQLAQTNADMQGLMDYLTQNGVLV